VAFNTTLRLRRRTDHVCLYHVYASATHDNDGVDERSGGGGGGEVDLPESMQQDSVRRKFESLLLHTLPINRFSFHWQDRTGSLKEGLLELVQEYQRALLSSGPPPLRVLPDFFVLGFSKSHTSEMFPQTPNVDNEGGGSCASFVLRSLPFPCIVAKRVCPDGPRAFVMAVDDSATSKRGFDMLLTVMCPRDSLRCVHVLPHTPSLSYSPSYSSPMHEEFKGEGGGTGTGEEGEGGEEERRRWRQEIKDDMVRRAPMDSEYVLLQCGEGEGVAEALVRFVNQSGPDFFAIAPRTRTSVQLSALSEFVLEHVDASIILCKN